jgi:hypothetical protein
MAARESWEQQRARERRESEARMETACAVLERLGVQSVDVDYDGSGDEGFIQGVSYHPMPPAGIPEGLQGLLEDVALRGLPDGWEINEGSYGTLRIDVRSRKAASHHHWRGPDPLDWQEDDQTSDWVDDQTDV